jgi:hypothetical protein
MLTHIIAIVIFDRIICSIMTLNPSANKVPAEDISPAIG